MKAHPRCPQCVYVALTSIVSMVVVRYSESASRDTTHFERSTAGTYQGLTRRCDERLRQHAGCQDW